MNSTNMLLAAPELWVMVMACVILIVDLYLGEERRGIIHMLAILTLVFAAIITLRADYAADGVREAFAFNGSYIRDTMGDVLKLFSFLILAIVYTYAKFCLRQFRMFRADFYTLSLFALLGVMLLISANSLVMIYLGLELISLSSYALVAFDRDSRLGSEAAIKYFVLGSMASGMLLYGMSMIYGATGTMDLGQVAQAVRSVGSDDPLLVFGLVFLVVGLAFKLGVVPFHMWIPDVYQGAPVVTTLFISSVPKMAAFAMAIRLLQTGLVDMQADWSQMLSILAVLSIILGNVAAIAQTNIKRMLAYSTISHMGFVLMGLLPGTAMGYGAGMFYVIVYSLMSAAGFGMVILLSARGVEAEKLDDFKGLNQRNSWYAAIMAMVMFSMAGVPVFVGFFAKWMVIKAALDAGLMWLAIIAVIFSVVGAFYYLRVVKLMYFDEPLTEAEIDAPVDFRAAISLNGIMMIGLGIFSSSLIAVCMASFGA
ncbi:MAG: NADH-quinone oxidoreductase subunit NuoN [Xanthomonadales bacterium]|nr:NADH-quinone oxidoreductase subunit NuoN [Gammaproteobacteria bacterium]MBT8054472.1 NADH-quinone oxidoreductase subunit NuoN [Gammaproteobacteria bacterium]NND57687.1 NADH-quinone oxidoreductase subunit NuoN [Xanthomonadales bacterium]NNK52642.1 NADH-quinone oxidoreductase subunit NuoN [Xanthomonadales bacterium]